MTKSLQIITREGGGLKGVSAVVVDITPTECPICHMGVQPIDRGLGWLIKNETIAEQVLQCPIEDCQHFFVARYVRDYPKHYKLAYCVPLEPPVVPQSPTISRISPDFCAIYEQAEEAYLLGLVLVAGPGYRKALEFLIKDYIIGELAIERASVENAKLGTCIQDYIKSEEIRETAKRAAWLGNDETHYMRKWKDKELTDLKKLITLTIHWIEMKTLTAEVMEDMPTGKP